MKGLHYSQYCMDVSSEFKLFLLLTLLAFFIYKYLKKAK